MTSGRFAINYWPTEVASVVQNSSAEEFADDITEARRTAVRMVQSGRFGYAQIQEFDSDKGEWFHRDDVTIGDADPV